MTHTPAPQCTTCFDTDIAHALHNTHLHPIAPPLCAGLFVFAYCVYFHVARSGFSSFLQLSRYYGYMAPVCLALFHMLATVGFTASMAFVRLIYRSIKSD